MQFFETNKLPGGLSICYDEVGQSLLIFPSKNIWARKFYNLMFAWNRNIDFNYLRSQIEIRESVTSYTIVFFMLVLNFMHIGGGTAEQFRLWIVQSEWITKKLRSLNYQRLI